MHPYIIFRVPVMGFYSGFVERVKRHKTNVIEKAAFVVILITLKNLTITLTSPEVVIKFCSFLIALILRLL